MGCKCGRRCTARRVWGRLQLSLDVKSTRRTRPIRNEWESPLISSSQAAAVDSDNDYRVRALDVEWYRTQLVATPPNPGSTEGRASVDHIAEMPVTNSMVDTILHVKQGRCFLFVILSKSSVNLCNRTDIWIRLTIQLFIAPTTYHQNQGIQNCFGSGLRVARRCFWIVSVVTWVMVLGQSWKVNTNPRQNELLGCNDECDFKCTPSATWLLWARDQT
jgi:hypothetical protein